MSLQCEHKNLVEGVCTECGGCIETSDLQFDLNVGFPYKNSSFNASKALYSDTHNISAYRYVEKDPLIKDITKIKAILLLFNLECYLYQVKDMLLTIKFKGRLCLEDKILLSLYYIVKSHSYPMALQDLLKYSKISKFRLLKIYRDTFSYRENTEEYLIQLYQRTRQKLFNTCRLTRENVSEVESKFESKCSHGSYSLQMYLSYCDKFKNTDPKLLCLAMFYEFSDISFEELKEFDDYTVHQINYTRRKLRESINACS